MLKHSERVQGRHGACASVHGSSVYRPARILFISVKCRLKTHLTYRHFTRFPQARSPSSRCRWPMPKCAASPLNFQNSRCRLRSSPSLNRPRIPRKCGNWSFLPIQPLASWSRAHNKPVRTSAELAWGPRQCPDPQPAFLTVGARGGKWCLAADGEGLEAGATLPTARRRECGQLRTQRWQNHRVAYAYARTQTCDKQCKMT